MKCVICGRKLQKIDEEREICFTCMIGIVKDNVVLVEKGLWKTGRTMIISQEAASILNPEHKPENIIYYMRKKDFNTLIKNTNPTFIRI